MKFIFICNILMVIVLNNAVIARNERYVERIVAAEQNRMDKQERLIIGEIVPADKNLHSKTDKQERLIINGIVAANPESRKDQIKLQSVVKA